MKYLVLVFLGGDVRCGVIVDRSGVVVDCCGVVVDRCGSLSIVVGRCGSSRVLVTTLSQIKYLKENSLFSCTAMHAKQRRQCFCLYSVSTSRKELFQLR